MSQEVYIVSATRTPVGKARGTFRSTRPDDLLALVIKGLLAQTPTVDPALIEDVIVGCAMPEGEQGMNVARIGLLLAGLPNSVPGMTINRFCSSGLQTIALAAERITLGDADIIIAGGTESMSMVPLGGNKYTANPAYFATKELTEIAYGMGLTAECVAEKWQVTRDEQDQFALESHRRALAAIEAGAFKAEITPVATEQNIPVLATGKLDTRNKMITIDEGPRKDTSMEALAKLPTLFKMRGTVTAGNTSQMSDGAAALLVVSEKALKAHNLKPIAKFKGFAVAGVEPKYMGIGPIAAIPKVLKKVGMQLKDMEWIELNEAFAAQSLAVIKEVGLDQTKVNPLGGAIALGHPLGATGAIRAATLIHGLRHIGKKHGMVTMCIGTGMGAAGIFEVLYDSNE